MGFESWSDLEVFLKQYEAETYQNFRVRKNNKVADRNKKILAFGSKAPLVPEVSYHYPRTFICARGRKYKPKVKGKRKRQHSRSLQCSAQIHACVQVVDPSGLKFALKLTSVQLEHNHPLAKHTYNLYPQTRMAYEPDVLAMVDELRKVGAKKKIILAYIHDHSVCKPTRKDVHNLVDKLKKEAHSAPTRAKRLKRWMIEFTEEPGNIGRIFVDKVQDKLCYLCFCCR
ncbi:hypothetical protein F442_02804 [Phytophthora nicotianae P10297]|uniref:FAR1 domain-containing protein n=1 Tax=Phytophthora nicotianae P10297 TaxID=1317064 RepID=W2ZXY9_PHYNI|nr:hypothetical protein F442_02804 [Phytophthora nicotianae P10297]